MAEIRTADGRAGVLRWQWLCAVVAAISVPLVAWVVSAASETASLGAASADAVPAVATTVAGLAMLRRHWRRLDGWLLLAAGLTGELAGLRGQSVLPVARDLAELFSALPDALLLHAILVLPRGRLADRWSRTVVALAYLAAGVTEPFVRSLSLGQVRCQAGCVRVVAWHNAIVYGIANPITTVLDVAIILMAVTCLWRRYVRSSTAGKRMLGPVLQATVAAGVFNNLIPTLFWTGGNGHLATLTFSGPYVRDDVLRLLSQTALCAIPFSFLVGDVRSKRGAALVGSLLTDIDDADEHLLQELVVRALADPSASVGDVGSAPTLHDQVSTPVFFGDRLVAQLHHDPALREHPAALDAVIAALGLVVGRRQLLAETAQHQIRLTEAVKRAVEAGSREHDTLAESADRLKSAFAAYVDPQLTEQVLLGGLDIAPHEVEVTVLAVDVRDFTTYAERVSAAAVFARLNALWEVVVPVLAEYGGHAHRYVGDGLIAVFGAPVPAPDHADRAVAAAVEIERAVTAAFAGEVRVGIGVHSGPAVAGTLGGGGHLEYAIVGPTIDAALAVEAATKRAEGRTLLTEAVHLRMASAPSLLPGPAVQAGSGRVPVATFSLLPGTELLGDTELPPGSLVTS